MEQNFHAGDSIDEIQTNPLTSSAVNSHSGTYLKVLQ